VIVRDALLHPRVLEPGEPAQEAAALLAKPSVESVLVVDGGRLVGSVNARAIVAAVGEGRDLRRLTVGDLREPDVASVGPDTTLEHALHLMAEGGLERLAVTEDGRLLGVLSREPLLRRLAEDEPPSPPEEP
jgi:CBS domain-containing protein